MFAATASTPHKHDIPTMSSQAHQVNVEACFSELSFCLPTSLAFSNRLTWEQTPWATCTLHGRVTNYINERDAHIITEYLTTQCGLDVPNEAIQHALSFGVAYSPDTNEPNGVYPQFFVVFPHLKRNISRDPNFLEIWHDQIVKPAFDRAWKDSGLVKVCGSEKDHIGRFLPSGGTHTDCDAHPAKGFLERLANGNPGFVNARWPEWPDSPVAGRASEGKHSNTRAKIFDEAWKSIIGMVDGHPDMNEFREPFLLAVYREQIHLNHESSLTNNFRLVADEWHKFVDSRFVVPGSFKVVLDTVIGSAPEMTMEVEREETQADDHKSVGRIFKRMAVDGLEVDDSGHGAKRARVISELV